MEFKLSISESELCDFVTSQVNNSIPDPNPVQRADIVPFVSEALQRAFHCFSKIKLKYYRIEGRTVFNHLNSDQYCMFLYYLSNTAYNKGNEQIATKCFLLNKYLHGIDAFYAIKLPDVFLVVHPLGTVLGNAKYDDYFVVYQNCTIGASVENIYPTFGKQVILYSKASVLGASTLGSNVICASNSFILNKNISSDQVILGAYPDNRIIPNTTEVFNNLFDLQ